MIPMILILKETTMRGDNEENYNDNATNDPDTERDNDYWG
jgi:hypothetical protein